MDIRQLHYFLVLCEEMNYTRAAQRLFLSRQALRQSISALEAELCGPLFLSAHHRLSLTDRGVSLQRHAAQESEFLHRVLPEELSHRYYEEELKRCAALKAAADPAEYERVHYFNAI